LKHNASGKPTCERAFINQNLKKRNKLILTGNTFEPTRKNSSQRKQWQ